MIKIRQVEIFNFRSIKHLSWQPKPGLNCLIGPGDSGKSSILDAIELCMGVGTRRASSLSDSDFYLLNPENKIRIELTIGGLDERLLDLEDYGYFIRGFADVGILNDEPAPQYEPVLSLVLTIDEYREPVWSLYSERAHNAGLKKNLSRKDKEMLFSVRLNTANTERNLTWSAGSVLTRLTLEELDVNASLLKAARLAKTTFGDAANAQVADSLAIVSKAAKSLGVPVGDGVKALLDTQFLSLKEAAITLHGSDGVPLRCLGTGSTRLLVAGLLREVSQAAPVVLVDEIEFGLEPHRLTRLLNTLGSKEKTSPSQVFITTHSPIALQQLRSEHLQVVRRKTDKHFIHPAGSGDDIQGLFRKSPSPFLADKVIVCEGASEMGLLRGIDDYYVGKGSQSLLAYGVALCDAGGGSPRSCIEKAILFAKLGYKVAAFIDNDVAIQGDCIQRLTQASGTLFTWKLGIALEDALFMYVSDAHVTQLLDIGHEFVGEDSMTSKIKEHVEPTWNFAMLRKAGVDMGYPAILRAKISRASRTAKKDKATGEITQKKGWFKSIERMEAVGSTVVGPELDDNNTGLSEVLIPLNKWATE